MVAAGIAGTLVPPPVDLDTVYQQFLNFLQEYEQDGAGVPHHPGQVEKMISQDNTTLFIDLDHLRYQNLTLYDVVEEHFILVEPALRKAVQGYVRELQPQYTTANDDSDKEFFICLDNVSNVEHMRALKADVIGQLKAFSGTVTRTSEVRPELYSAAFRCLQCNTVVRNVLQQFKFTMPCICTNPTCGNKPDSSKRLGTNEWELLKEESVFIDWQRCKVQENTDEIPAGSLPRTMDVIVRGALVETARPGDKLTFTGTLCVVPDIGAIATPGERKTVVASGPKGGGDFAGGGDGVTGLSSLGVRELSYKLCFLAYNATPATSKGGQINIRSDDDASVEAVLGEYTAEQARTIQAMLGDPELYAKLARSIAPQVYGNEDIKKAILLLLLGGVHKVTPEGINLRGDINVAIVGDPACAKSQLLKWVSNFLPRAVYTSGKSSSAAGLTATVVKEVESNEFCIEAGALMLADNGVCCIDEFDKMDPKDQVAIHEAMEQQTISITKAGIQATLNARTSILAAANPIGGRYDKSKQLKWNVALPPAILSRFDLLHIMVDEPSEIIDAEIARHIVNVHLGRVAELKPPYSRAELQRFIRYARAHKPQMTSASRQQMVGEYGRLRGDDAAPGSGAAYRITIRQLEALVRLCEALARCGCTAEITPAHVREARRLLKNSLVSIERPDVEVEDDDDGVLGQGVLDRLHRDNAALLAMAEAPEAGGEPMAVDGAGGDLPPTQPVEEESERGGGAGPREEPPAPPAAQAPKKPKKTAITAKEFTRLKNLVILKLRRGEEEQAAAASAAAELAAGATQRDLLEWYVDHELVERGMQYTEAELDAQLLLMHKVVQHLIKREGVVVVVSEPEREEFEEDTDFRRRVNEERVLALNPNFVME